MQHDTGRGSDSHFEITNPHSIPPSQSTRSFVKDIHKKSFILRETRLLLAFIISIAIIVACLVLILRFNTCEVNTASFSVISTVLGAWLSLVRRNQSDS